MGKDGCGQWGWANLDGRPFRVYCNDKPGHDGSCLYRSSSGQVYAIDTALIIEAGRGD